MRLLIKAEMSTEAGNARIKDGSLPNIIGSVLESLKPEATYFTLSEGKRTAYFFANVNDPSELPKLCEPLFLAFNAKIEVVPAMVPEDLHKAGEDIMQAVEKFGKYSS